MLHKDLLQNNLNASRAWLVLLNACQTDHHNEALLQTRLVSLFGLNKVFLRRSVLWCLSIMDFPKEESKNERTRFRHPFLDSVVMLVLMLATPQLTYSQRKFQVQFKSYEPLLDLSKIALCCSLRKCNTSYISDCLQHKYRIFHLV